MGVQDLERKLARSEERSEIKSSTLEMFGVVRENRTFAFRRKLLLKTTRTCGMNPFKAKSFEFGVQEVLRRLQSKADAPEEKREKGNHVKPSPSRSQQRSERMSCESNNDTPV